MILAMSPTNPEQQRPKIATFVFGTPWLIFLFTAEQLRILHYSDRSPNVNQLLHLALSSDRRQLGSSTVLSFDSREL